MLQLIKKECKPYLKYILFFTVIQLLVGFTTVYVLLSVIRMLALCVLFISFRHLAMQSKNPVVIIGIRLMVMLVTILFAVVL